jgi:hypothetical protein
MLMGIKHGCGFCLHVLRLFHGNKTRESKPQPPLVLPPLIIGCK